MIVHLQVLYHFERCWAAACTYSYYILLFFGIKLLLKIMALLNFSIAVISFLFDLIITKILILATFKTI